MLWCTSVIASSAMRRDERSRMPVKAGEQIDPEATKARILDVASQVFYERGVHAAGIQEIANRAAASKLTIYHYFDSKEGLVKAVVQARSDRIHEWIEREISDLAPGRERILGLFNLLADWFQRKDFQGCAVMNAAIDTRGGTCSARELAREHLARYLVLLRRCLVEAGVAEPTVLARQLLVLIEGVTVINAVETDKRFSTDTRKIVELLLDSAIATSTAETPVEAAQCQ
jgi:AcrR family transcriptional regulator